MTLSHEALASVPDSGQLAAKKGISKSLMQTYLLRDRIYQLAMLEDNPYKLARLCRAHDALCDRVRILRNKPLPGVLTPEKRNSRRSKSLSEAPAVIDVASASVSYPEHQPGAIALMHEGATGKAGCGLDTPQSPQSPQ